MPTKIGFHCLQSPTGIGQLVSAGCALVTAVDDMGILEEAERLQPGIPKIARFFVPNITAESMRSGDPIAAAKWYVNESEMAAKIRANLPILRNPSTRLQGPNEPVFKRGDADDPDGFAWYAAFEAERVRLLFGLGIKAACFNFSTGYPDIALLKRILPALPAMRMFDSWLCIHGYSVVPMARDNENTNRHEIIYREFLKPGGYGDIPVAYTEWGPLEWKTLLGEGGGAEDTLVAWVSEADTRLRAFPGKLVGVSMYTLGGNDDWKNFRLDGNLPDKLATYIRAANNIPDPPGGWDFGKVSRVIERYSSGVAFTTAYIRGKNIFNRTGQFWPKIADFNNDLYGELGAKTSKEIEYIAEEAALNPSKLDDLISADKDLGITGSKLKDLAEKRIGKPLGNVIPDEFWAANESKIVEALQSRNTTKIQEAFQTLRNDLDLHIQNLHEEALGDMLEEALARTKTEGPGAFTKIWGDSMDEWWGATVRYDMDAAKAAESIRTGMAPELVDAQWKRFMTDGQRYWERAWSRLEARFEGMTKGAKEVGLKLESDAVMADIRQWRKDWKGFFDLREKSYNSFFEARLKGETPKMSFEDITAKLDKEYQKIIANEAKYTKRIDAAVADLLPDNLRPVYSAWRDRIAEWRKADKLSVLSFRRQIRGLPYSEVQRLYARHWQERIKMAQQIWAEERMGLAALQGNPVAQASYQASIQKARQMLNAEKVALQDAVKAAGFRDFRDAVDTFINNPGDDRFAKLTPLFEKGTFPLTTERIQQRIEEFATLKKSVFGIPEYEPTAGATLTMQQKIERAEKIAQAARPDEAKTLADIRKSEEAGGLSAEQQTANAALRRYIENKISARLQPPRNFLPDFETVVKPEQYLGLGLDQLVYTRSHDALETAMEEGLRMIQEPPLKWQNLSDNAKDLLRGYFEHVKSGMADARYASVKFGEFGRDSALLNYNRRMNYNTWIGTFMPYEFWTTQSMMKWALHSIDRPQMLAFYYRMRKFLASGYRPDEGLPSRLRGTTRLTNIPFLPEWMQGTLFVDPLRIALPLDSWFGIPEQIDRQMLSDEGVTLRKLQELKNDGQISTADYNMAVAKHEGPAWAMAMSLAMQDDSEQRLNGWDFAAMMSTPHAPLMWAYNYLKPGEQQGAVLPITNTIGSVAGAFGLDPAGPYNPEAAIRKKLGYHPFNKWDDYYVERMVVNMISEGTISAQDGRVAMETHQGAAWIEAYRRTWAERSGGPVGAFLGLIGLPPKSLPEGEQTLRGAKDEYEAAWKEYDRLLDLDVPNPYEKAFGDFNKKYPGYEERLALFKKPEERLRQFLVDDLWNRWNELPRITQDEVKEQLGDDFVDKFLTKETRSYDAISPDTLAVWLKLMGGDPLYIDVPYVPPLQLTDPAIANKAQVFYDTRKAMFADYAQLSEEFQKVPKGERVYVAPADVVAFYQEKDKMFPGINSLQDQYFNLPKGTGQRKQFISEHPELKEYWGWRDQQYDASPAVKEYIQSDKPITRSRRSIWIDQHPEYKAYLKWRTDWMLRNPDAAIHITDKLPEEVVRMLGGQPPQQGVPNFTHQEWVSTIGPFMVNVTEDYANGVPLSESARELLEIYADDFGFPGSAEEFADLVAASP